MKRHHRTPRRAALALTIGSLVAVTTLPAAAQQDSSGIVSSKTGLVITSSAPASDVGAAILARGGNAVDAAVATALALAVTYPGAGNIGGGGFMVIRPAKGEPITIDYREVAPLASTRTMYLDSTGQINRRLTATGYLAPGVPGTVRGLATAHKRFGTLPWRDVVMPAVELAEQGFPLSPDLARSLNYELTRGMSPYPASLAAYGKPGGGEWQAGDRIVLKDLGRTLRAIATQGPDAFYTGWIADSIAASMKQGGGLITKRDLARYQARVRAPVRGKFNGYEIITMPPPSSGGVAMVEMLNMLEHLRVDTMPRFGAQTLHYVIESMRRAYLDRARWLGDPDFVQVPVARLTSKTYASRLAQTIDRTRATSSTDIGKDIVTMVAATASEPEETTHFSIVDRDGNAVANTFTLEGGYGSHVVVSGAGFLLNNEMGDFNKKPGETNVQGDIGTPANLIVPGKRMLSSMTPTIVTRDGALFLVTGSPGGRTIINTVMEVVLNTTAFKMNARQAVDAPRLHHQWLPDVAMFETNAIPDSTAAALRALGHTVEVRGEQGDAHTIMYDAKTKTAHGANDRRSEDSKASTP